MENTCGRTNGQGWLIVKRSLNYYKFKLIKISHLYSSMGPIFRSILPKMLHYAVLDLIRYIFDISSSNIGENTDFNGETPQRCNLSIQNKPLLTF